jgi:hypothetical protein
MWSVFVLFVNGCERICIITMLAIVRLVLVSVPYAMGYVRNSNYVIHQLVEVCLTVVIISHLSSLMDLSNISLYFCLRTEGN